MRVAEGDVCGGGASIHQGKKISWREKKGKAIH